MSGGAVRKREVVLVRHGETEWTQTGQHTGRSDIALIDAGRSAARRLAPALARHEFDLVLTSPLLRARQSCELAGFADRAQLEPDLAEWDYGQYEGLTTAQIHSRAPGWVVFEHGCPGGESPEQVAARIDRVIARVRTGAERALLFGHGHLFRVFAARWIGLPPAEGCRFTLDTSTLCTLGYYRDVPALARWNAPLADDTP